MNQRIVWIVLLSAALGSGALGTACKKQSSAASQGASQSFAQLPEATNVTAALDQKDYETAVTALAKLKESVSTEEQQNEYRILLGQVKDKVVEAAASDPKAVEAMQALRVMISGR